MTPALTFAKIIIFSLFFKYFKKKTHKPRKNGHTALFAMCPLVVCKRVRDAAFF